MKKLFCLCLCVAVLCGCLVGCGGEIKEKAKAPAVSDATFLADDTDARFRILDSDGNTVITESHIEQAYYDYDAVYDSHYVFIKLDRTGTELLGYVTSQSIGEKLPIYLDGELIYEPTVNDKADDGVVNITLESQDEAVGLYEKIAAAMHGEEK